MCTCIYWPHASEMTIHNDPFVIIIIVYDDYLVTLGWFVATADPHSRFKRIGLRWAHHTLLLFTACFVPLSE